MADWIFDALYLLAAASVAFWGWKRKEKPLWPVALVAIFSIAMIELAGALFGAGGGVSLAMVTLVFLVPWALFHFSILWLVWFFVGLVVKQLRRVVAPENVQRLAAARWAAPVVFVVARYFMPWWAQTVFWA
ncbi:hypothetical protein Q9Q94_07975 [Uliginosibacterium sp. 31-16]|uniref:hypothetical protein n=1 Tax=Uliginosibacterium sp. 31-16 TaxID=3068315 RepID=UPI00273E3F0A|nr:hypothetical protein [Uliginosibacterium sp. 31-16]MDP5239463.1 hypothetical protein [Uliginosibacterium sp. 31-16]